MSRESEKQQRRGSPLAKKGRARPLPGGLPHAGDTLETRARPPGVHTRPELFGASAVVLRPAKEEKDEGAERAPSERPEEAASDNGASPSPAASLLSQPWRIAADFTVETPPSEAPEEAADATESAAASGSEDDGEAEAPAARSEVPPPPVATGLAQRWPLFAGLGIAAALVAYVLADGLLSVPMRGAGAPQSAQAPETPGESAEAESAAASAQPAAAEPGARGDISLTPAAGDGPAEAPPSPAATGPHGPALASKPETGTPAAQAASDAPVVDFMRLDRDGRAIVAGRAAPGTELTILDNGETLGRVTADPYGLWSFASARPLSEGRHKIGVAVDSRILSALAPLDVDAAPAEVEAEGPEAALAETEQANTAALPEDTAPAAEEEPAAEEPSTSTATEDLALIGETAADGVSTDAADGAVTAGSRSQTAPETAPEAVQSAALPKDGAAAVAAGEGRYLIQLASFETATRAEREQANLREDFADLLTGLELFVDEARLDDLGTVFRVRLGPFASLEDARAACARFEARAHDCLALRR